LADKSFTAGGDMRQIQASEAEAGFDELLDQVENGETVAITRDGKVIAIFGPGAPPNFELPLSPVESR
jgi:antitoxin (DNA-binding transcriptional repressor) of toxin-antitoxin stability system